MAEFIYNIETPSLQRINLTLIIFGQKITKMNEIIYLPLKTSILWLLKITSKGMVKTLINK